ncbi:hypothetical protein SAMN05421759_104171 [Roseivivax lentus]|uniref:Uncharacterized protein n=1 Tax=Roseivivax lentus TaxID=633194 RepID=A0A1N7MBN3_9RHOB|nr:hypothetical protein SAMN05421759_104171 [Roseivivax lentus]
MGRFAADPSSFVRNVITRLSDVITPSALTVQGDSLQD